jgi:hypothetical protein
MPQDITGLQIARGGLRKRASYQEGHFESEAWKPKFLTMGAPASAGGLVLAEESSRTSGDINEVD